MFQNETTLNSVGSDDFSIETKGHRLQFLKGDGTLVVSFDDAMRAKTTPFIGRSIWGQKFYRCEGHSLLGIIARSNDWFRCGDLIKALKGLAASGFFQKFDHVVLTGASMGAFAALSFAPLIPGCTVIAMSPQATRDPKRVPWETRFPDGRNRDWTLEFNDAAKGVMHASRAYIFYDSLNRLDRRHAHMIATTSNVHLLPIPAGGHGVPPMLVQMGILKEVTRTVIQNKMDRSTFIKRMRSRKNTLRYYNILAIESLCRKKNAFALRVANAGLEKFPNSDLWELKALALVALGKPVLALQALEERRKRRKNP